MTRVEARQKRWDRGEAEAITSRPRQLRPRRGIKTSRWGRGSTFRGETSASRHASLEIYRPTRSDVEVALRLTQSEDIYRLHLKFHDNYITNTFLNTFLNKFRRANHLWLCVYFYNRMTSNGVGVILILRWILARTTARIYEIYT